ncbi:ARM repeat-containing protein [Hypoxylon sp. NC1633]|nr:ARM repeat-containing protein [Hypoxylon sp. NC1633]
MSFAIEVPGAATPLSFAELRRALENASSYDNNARQSATQQLTTWEQNSEYYPILQSVFLDTRVSKDARFQAIIQLKNGIDRHWRHQSIASCISEKSRQAIRERLFQGTVKESDRQLATHNALIIAKVVRVDFPNMWRTPMTDLTKLLRETKDGDQLELSGALTILLRIVKELATARLQRSQTTLQQAAPELVHVLGEIYDAKTSEWISFLNNGREDDYYDHEGDRILLMMENSLDALKILRRLLLVGYKEPHKDNSVQQVWSFSQVQFAQFLGFIHSNSKKLLSYSHVLGKHLVQFTKLHIEMAEMHPASFAALPNSLDLVRAYWDLTTRFAEVYNKSDGLRQETSLSGQPRSKVEGPILERLALKGLLLVRACLKMVHHTTQTIRYRSPSTVQEHQELIDHLKKDLFKDELIIQMTNILITHFFIFRQADLEAWDEEPQEWEQQEESQGNAYEWEVRPCAEKLFLDLLLHYKKLLLPPLLSYFDTVQNQQADIVSREAVYTAMGLSAAVVFDDFNFEAVLKSSVTADAQQTGPMCRVLRRRIAILLSQWVPVNVSKESRPLVYEIFRHFLNPNDQCNDVVVRITAARQFKVVVNDFGFDGEMFLSYASDVLTQLIGLLQEVEIDETKLAILETTRSLIERMDTQVSQFGDMVMNAVPAVWGSAGDLGFMMKQSVLAIIQSLVVSMKTESQRYQPMILPLIVEATQENTELYLYLIDEALELWSNIVIHTQPPFSPELLRLADTAIKQLQLQNEHALTFTGIIGSYIMLAPESLLGDQYRNPVLAALSTTLSSTRREGRRDHISATIRHVESFIQLAHEIGGLPGLRVVAQDLMATGFLPKIFEDIHACYEAHQESGPKKRLDSTHILSRVNIVTLTDYLSLLAWIALFDPALFVELLISLGPLDQVWNWLSSEWFGAFDGMAGLDQQKLSLMALTRLLELPQPMQDLVLSKLQDYFSMWTSTLIQLISNDPADFGTDMLVLTIEPGPQEWDTPKSVRERALYATDPVRRVSALSFVKERLNDLVRRVGGDQAFQDNWAVNVDKDVLSGFQAVGALPSGEA